MTRLPTVYANQRNRCDCAHRKIMHNEDGCTVVMNKMPGAIKDFDHPCTCKKRYADS